MLKISQLDRKSGFTGKVWIRGWISNTTMMAGNEKFTVDLSKDIDEGWGGNGVRASCVFLPRVFRLFQLRWHQPKIEQENLGALQGMMHRIHLFSVEVCWIYRPYYAGPWMDLTWFSTQGRRTHQTPTMINRWTIGTLSTGGKQMHALCFTTWGGEIR